MKLAFARSLRKKLVGVALLTTMAALLVALGAMIAYDLRQFETNWRSDVETQAELLGRTTAPALAFDDPKVAQDNLELLGIRPQVRAAALYTARGALFASWARDATRAFAPLPEADGTHVRSGELSVYRRIVEDGEIVGTVYLATDFGLLERFVDYVLIAAVVALAALAVAYVLSARLQQILTRPVLALADVAAEVAERGDYSRRVEKLSGDEIGVMADSFNAMLAETERRAEALKASNEELEREVAERIRAEEEVLRLNAGLENRVRERTQQLEVANQELEAFCFSVSHDLRAPLRSIDGFSQALLEDFPGDVSETSRRYLGRIRASTLRMGQLIEDLLNLSRVSRAPLERVDVDLGAIARDVAAELASREPGRDVDWIVAEDMHADADPRLLHAALENLVGNAFKFTSNVAGRARIEVGVLRDGANRTFYVRDNGAGFDMAYQDKLFNAFQRLHSATEFPGTGIGLATVQRIVHRHGGRIWADAQVGKGAVFYFTLGRPADAPGRIEG